MSSRILCAFALTLLLVACSYTPAKPLQSIDPAEIKIAEAATAVSHAMTTMAEVEQAASAKPDLATPPKPSSYGMGNLASIDWNGPIEPLVKVLAKATKYSFKAYGQEPAIPIMVTIYASNQPIGSILRDAGLQTGSRANIIVYPATKTIELRYVS